MSFDPFDPFASALTRAVAERSKATEPVARPRSVSAEALEQLRPLLAAAARLEVEDHGAWAEVRATAHHVAGVAIARGALPLHLAVGPADPPARVARTLAAAWRHVSRAT